MDSNRGTVASGLRVGAPSLFPYPNRHEPMWCAKATTHPWPPHLGRAGHPPPTGRTRPLLAPVVWSGLITSPTTAPYCRGTSKSAERCRRPIFSPLCLILHSELVLRLFSLPHVLLSTTGHRRALDISRLGDASAATAPFLVSTVSEAFLTKKPCP
jgi:hypothetical protein